MSVSTKKMTSLQNHLHLQVVVSKSYEGGYDGYFLLQNLTTEVTPTFWAPQGQPLGPADSMCITLAEAVVQLM